MVSLLVLPIPLLLLLRGAVDRGAQEEEWLLCPVEGRQHALARRSGTWRSACPVRNSGGGKGEGGANKVPRVKLALLSPMKRSTASLLVRSMRCGGVLMGISSYRP